MWLGYFVPQLDDILAQIGFDRRDAMPFEMLVDGDLLADHRLSLGHGLCVRCPADRQNGFARFLGIGAPMHLAARFQHLCLVGFQVEIEVLQRMVLDIARGVPQLLELRQCGHRRGPPGDEAGTAARQGLLQAGVAQRRMGVLLESGGGRDVHGGSRSVLRQEITSPTGECHGLGPDARVRYPCANASEETGP